MRKDKLSLKVKRIFIFVISVCVLLSVSSSFAAVPRLINYQGRLTDSGGAPLNGSHSITFKIYDAEAAGSLLWEETQSVVVEKGIFSVMLGSSTALNLAFDKPYFLEIKVGGEVMSPRQQITASAYAMRAETAEKAESAEGQIKATGGLVVETRTSDPPSLATGQIWLRTDL